MPRTRNRNDSGLLEPMNDFDEERLTEPGIVIAPSVATKPSEEVAYDLVRHAHGAFPFAYCLFETVL